MGTRNRRSLYASTIHTTIDQKRAILYIRAAVGTVAIAADMDLKENTNAKSSIVHSIPSHITSNDNNLL